MIRGGCFGENLGTCVTEISGLGDSKVHSQKEFDIYSGILDNASGVTHTDLKDDDNNGQPFELYKKRTTIVIKRKIFLDVVCDALAEYKYVGLNQRADLALACRYTLLPMLN